MDIASIRKMSFFIGGELLIVKFHLNTRRYDEEALLWTELKVSGQVGGVQKRDAWAPCPGIITVFLWMTFWPRYVGCLLVDRCIGCRPFLFLPGEDPLETA